MKARTNLEPKVGPIDFDAQDPHSKRLMLACDYAPFQGDGRRRPPLPSGLFRQRFLSRRESRRARRHVEPHAHAGRHGDRLLRRPRRHAWRARALVQDEFLRRLGARPAAGRGPRDRGRQAPGAGLESRPDRHVLRPRRNSEWTKSRPGPTARASGRSSTAAPAPRPCSWSTRRKAPMRRWSRSARATGNTSAARWIRSSCSTWRATRRSWPISPWTPPTPRRFRDSAPWPMRAGTSGASMRKCARARRSAGWSTKRCARAPTTPWDYQPQQNASERFMRNHMNLDTLEGSKRFPRGR